MECDLAEIYRIYDYKELPPSKVALFACGLGHDSRVWRKFMNINYTLSELLQAILIDELRMFAWGLCGGQTPERLCDVMLGKEKEYDILTFDSGEEFDKAWKGGTA